MCDLKLYASYALVGGGGSRGCFHTRRVAASELSPTHLYSTYRYFMLFVCACLCFLHQIGGKISAEDKETISNALKETIEWMDEHKEATKDEMDEKRKELEKVCNPIIAKV